MVLLGNFIVNNIVNIIDLHYKLLTIYNFRNETPKICYPFKFVWTQMYIFIVFNGPKSKETGLLSPQRLIRGPIIYEKTLEKF